MMRYGNVDYLCEGLLAQFSYGEPVYIGDGFIRFRLQYQDLANDQGLTIQVMGLVEGVESVLLHFYCFDHDPHFFYGSEEKGHRINLDKTTEGDSLDCFLWLIKNRLRELIERASFGELLAEIDHAELETDFDEMDEAARKMAVDQRVVAVHNRGDFVIDAGPIRFGVENREPGIAIHVLGDVDGKEEELLTFDCFEKDPHYHYGPVAKNQRLYIDTVAIPDALQWTLDLFKAGKLVPMLERAGYHNHAALLNTVTVNQKVAELESAALTMRALRVV